MRLSLQGDSLIERAALRLGLVPNPALEAWAGMALSSTLITATQLRIFERLAQRPWSPDDLAHELALDKNVTRMLIHCLHSTGYLERRADSYQLSRSARRWLDPTSLQSVSHFVAACADYVPWWSNLRETITTGAIIDHHNEPTNSEYWTRYISGQRDLARLTSGEVSRRVRISGQATSMLDIGGGHGEYSVAICRRYRGLRSVVLDIPGSAQVGARLISDAEMDDRVRVVEGDALAAPFGHDHDVILCFNLIHHLSQDEVGLVFAKANAALRPGGTFYIMDGFAESSHKHRPAQAYASLFMYLSSGSRIYSGAAIKTALSAADFQSIRNVRIRRMPGVSMYSAMRRRG